VLKTSAALNDRQRAATAALPDEVPSWNNDPLVDVRGGIPHRLKQPCRDWLLLHAVEQRYIPRALVPLIEDIRYKESTRRCAIEKECKKRLKVLSHHRDMAFVRASEDSARVSIEIEEFRVCRVLQQWIVGKRLFAQTSLLVAKQETQGRSQVVAEAANSAAVLEQLAGRLHPVAQEEFARRNVLLIELDDRRTLTVRYAAAAATIESQSAASQKKRATAYALALWCVEGVIPEQHIHRVEDKDRKTSLAVLERQTVFNRFLSGPR
jgi:hypothetical protein